MRYEWEEELPPIGSSSGWTVQHHLKKVWDKDPLAHKFANPLIGTWKVTLAIVRRRGQRQWEVNFQAIAHTNNDKTFRSLKAAKAYALAIVTLE